MKIPLFFTVYFCTTMFLFGQEKISVAVGKSDTYIETYKKDPLQERMNKMRTERDSKDNSIETKYVLDKAMRIGPSSLANLKYGIDTALKWITLNDTHNKVFVKEIVRFKAMSKKDYKFFGYDDGLAREMVILFHGFENGEFKIEIKEYSSYWAFITITDLKTLKSFKDLLDGKPSGTEIDEIFKN